MKQGYQELFDTKQWYSENLGVDLATLPQQDISILEQITEGALEVDQLPKSISHKPGGFIANYERVVAAQTLQVADIERSYGPIISWVRQLAEDKEQRHWTTSQYVLDSIEVFANISEYREKLIKDDVISLLTEFGKDYYVEGKKDYPKRAMTMIASLGGETAVKALTQLQDESFDRLGSYHATALLEYLNS